MGLFYFMVKYSSYGKHEKLKGHKLINQLFAKGRSFAILPFKVFYTQPNEKLDSRVKAGMGVSKKYFRRAVHRNRVKRLMREVYRTEKKPLYDFAEQQDKQLVLFILYIDKTLPDLNQLKNKMPFVIARLIKQLHETVTEDT